MTSEAKIGLLIGLVSIFLIAFIINGIPISHKTNNNKLSTNMVSFENNPPGLAAKERRIQQVFESAKSTEQTQLASATPPVENNNLTAMALSSSPSTPAATNLSETAKTVPAHPPTTLAQPLAAAAEKTDIQVGSALRQSSVQAGSPQVKPSESSSPAVYVVVEGDTLGTIAKKVYGHSEKNNIIRLFQANRSTLKSSDELYVGQKLVIPPLLASQTSKNKLEKTSSPTLLEETKSISQKSAVTNAKDTHSAPHGTAHDAGRAKEENKSYVVQQGDSLWQIAAKHLGDGSRYQEILELNTGTLENEDSLAVGMCLKLPK
jgi:nucleoid-associated protein YgaU